MTDRYKKIRKALAMGPTPGPFSAVRSYSPGNQELIIRLTCNDEYGITENYCTVHNRLGDAWKTEADAAFIAACDPDTIRELLAERDQLAAALEAAQMGLRREESDHERTIDQRDAAEDALSRMFQAVTGRPAEWSSAWGYVDAIEEVEEHVAALAAMAARGEDDAWCAECGVKLENVRPGKHQHPICSQAAPQQPAAGAGEEIMVNAAHDVFTLPLQPSGLDGRGPRFVVHVPAQADQAQHQGEKHE